MTASISNVTLYSDEQILHFFLPITYGCQIHTRTFSILLIRISISLSYDGFFPWLGKRVSQREKRVERAQSRPTKGRIQFREKSTIRFAKTRHVISLHVSTRSSVIDRFESPSKVAPLFRGTYFLALLSPFFIHYTALLSRHTLLPLHRHIRKPLYFLPSYLVIVWQDSFCTFGLCWPLRVEHFENFFVWFHNI